MKSLVNVDDKKTVNLSILATLGVAMTLKYGKNSKDRIKISLKNSFLFEF